MTGVAVRGQPLVKARLSARIRRPSQQPPYAPASASDAEVLALPLDLVRVFVARLVSCAHDEVEVLVRGELRGVEGGHASSRRVGRLREVLATGRGCLVDVVDDLLRRCDIVRCRFPTE